MLGCALLCLCFCVCVCARVHSMRVLAHVFDHLYVHLSSSLGNESISASTCSMGCSHPTRDVPPHTHTPRTGTFNHFLPPTLHTSHTHSATPPVDFRARRWTSPPVHTITVRCTALQHAPPPLHTHPHTHTHCRLLGAALEPAPGTPSESPGVRPHHRGGVGEAGWAGGRLGRDPSLGGRGWCRRRWRWRLLSCWRRRLWSAP